VTEPNETLHELIQSVRPDMDEERLEGSLLAGWVLVAEWMDREGDRWLSRISHPGCTKWQREGYLHDALFDQEGFQ